MCGRTEDESCAARTSYCTVGFIAYDISYGGLFLSFIGRACRIGSPVFAVRCGEWILPRSRSLLRCYDEDNEWAGLTSALNCSRSFGPMDSPRVKSPQSS